jgi:hypothetical protein
VYYLAVIIVEVLNYMIVFDLFDFYMVFSVKAYFNFNKYWQI